MLQIPLGFTQCALVFRHEADPQPWRVTFAVKHGEEPIVGGGGGDDSATYFQRLKNVAAIFHENLLNEVSPQVQFVGVDGTVGQAGDADPLIISAFDGAQGSSDNPKLPQNCAILVAKNTQLGGRKGRGRMFFPGMAEEGQVDSVGNISDSTRNRLQGKFDDFLEALGSLYEGVAGTSRQTMYLLHNDDTEPSLVDSLTVKPVIATQRRRLR